MHDQENKQSYLSYTLFHPATILCKKDLIDEDTQYPTVNRQEDVRFFDRLNANNAIKSLVSPELYIYVYHGSNTYDRAHFDNI